jgi:hypothetical protein
MHLWIASAFAEGFGGQVAALAMTDANGAANPHFRENNPMHSRAVVDFTQKIAGDL